ncbi:MAG: exodeoxyribonuclease VII small subunit [Alkalispirochaetaceae bacterium]
MKSFEQRLERLETLSEKIRREDCGLEEATTYFEEGVKLARELEKELSRVEKRVEILVNEPDEEGEQPVLELFPEIRGVGGAQGEDSIRSSNSSEG